jgi:hypothetical protein
VTDQVISLHEARAAKEKAKLVFRHLGQMRGIGITRQGDSYAVKVNLETAPDKDTPIPHDIDGVPVIVHIVGRVHKQACPNLATSDRVVSFYMYNSSNFIVEYGWGGRSVDDSTW